MKKLILPVALATLTLGTLAACDQVETYPVSQCTTSDHYPVACQKIQEGESPADLEPVDVPSFKGA
ncbi:hypothetical protein [Celeribacter persicus]|jgi:hypothetical protein|uniref:Lipoprotein n=1 Tax=Celeribacter persicus TaxID=1651082 RepID=A0A2T5HUT5_9RHOB|nr:hypothetical protein [Celeribacter persicus]PTQ75363.1 hypothetical protein C8N42_102283 [Celeribacter persicus]